MAIEHELRQYILDNYLFGEDDGRLTPDGSLFDGGIIDSTGVLDLVSFIEATWGLKVADADLVPANFETIARMAAFISARLPAA